MQDASGKTILEQTSDKDPEIEFENINFHCPSCDATYTIVFKYID